MSSFRYRSGGFNKWGFVMNLTIALSIIALFLLALGYIANSISIESAHLRFQELAETNDVVIVRNSNNFLIVGDPLDVTFELLVEGKPTSGRCTAQAFSPMVCRLYSPGQGD